MKQRISKFAFRAKRFNRARMFGAIVLLLITVALLVTVKSVAQEEKLSYSEDLSEWYELPASVVAKIDGNPAFGALCLWEITSANGKSIPFLRRAHLKSWPAIRPLAERNNSDEKLVPGSIVKVADGWLVACNWDTGGEVSWFSKSKLERTLIAEEWINQFQRTDSGDEVIAAQGEWTAYKRRGGKVLRFYRNKRDGSWSRENLVDFQFGEVLGVAPGWSDGILVYSENGWWKIGSDGNVDLLWSYRDLCVGGITIAIAGNNKAYVGGKRYVKEVDLETKKSKSVNSFQKVFACDV